MSTVDQTESLTALIHSLEARRKDELISLKAQLHLTGESMKPGNLIKSAANELTGDKTIKSYLIQAGIGLAVGFLTKKILEATKGNRPDNLIGKIAEIGLNKMSFNGSGVIKIAAPIVLGLIVNAIKNRRRKP